MDSLLPQRISAGAVTLGRAFLDLGGDALGFWGCSLRERSGSGKIWRAPSGAFLLFTALANLSSLVLPLGGAARATACSVTTSGIIQGDAAILQA
jgi:hypothetical protein